MGKYEKLKKVRENLKNNYHNEFLVQLVKQAVDRKDRYRPINHSKLEAGDIVSIKQPFSKPLQYPMGVIQSVTYNDLGETVSATVKKSNKQIINKHVNDLIILLRPDHPQEDLDRENIDPVIDPQSCCTLPPRKAKYKAKYVMARYKDQ